VNTGCRQCRAKDTVRSRHEGEREVQKIYATGSEPKEQDGILPLCSRVPPRTWELQYKEQAKLAMREPAG